MDRARVVLHVDMDAFYASVEMRDDPTLRGVPVIVGADPKLGQGRGVVMTANYPARAFGVRSAMPIGRAYDLCPHARFVRPDFEKYADASDRVMDVLARYADVLEVVGMDEAYLDVSARCATADGTPDWDAARSLARSLQAAVKREVGISCSVGASVSKSMAKVASDHQKPHGVTVVPGSDVLAFLEPLPVRALWGCGPKTALRLKDEGYATVGDVQRASQRDLGAVLGSHGEWLWLLARGVDDRRVSAEHGQRKSRGNERTFGQDQTDHAHVLRTAARLADGLLEDADRDGRAFHTVTVKLRYADFTTRTRSRSVETPLEPTSPVTATAVHALVRDLLGGLMDERRVRLVGVRLSNFVPAVGQRPLSAYGVSVPGDAGLVHSALRTPGLAALRPTRQGIFDPGLFAA